MKIRSGFVSNSSSASFIISFKANCSRSEVEEMIRLSDEWLDKHWNTTRAEGIDFSAWKKGTKSLPTKVKIVKCSPKRNVLKREERTNKYSINVDTSMFNDWTDVPAWKFTRSISEKRNPKAELIEIRKTEEEYSDCNRIDEFVPYVWNIESAGNGKLKCTYGDAAEKKKALDHQENIEMCYLEYLHNINSELTKDEVFRLSKYQLKGRKEE